MLRLGNGAFAHLARGVVLIASCVEELTSGEPCLVVHRASWEIPLSQTVIPNKEGLWLTPWKGSVLSFNKGS